MQYYCCRVDLSSHETLCCCRGVNVIAAESCGVTKLRWVRAARRGVTAVVQIYLKASNTDILFPCVTVEKAVYYEAQS